MAKRFVPFFSLKRQMEKLQNNVISRLTQVLESQQFIGGSFVTQCEKDLAEYNKTAHVVSCNSGTDALWLALKALNLKKNDIVLTTPFSFIASSSEIVALKGHPVFIDIDETTFNIDPQKISAWLTKHAQVKNGIAIHTDTGFPITGIVSVDIFGQCADYDALNKIAKQWNLWIVEDTAQAIGASYNEKMAGTLGTIGTFSFYPTKNLGAFGDAGCCVTNDPQLAQKLLELRNHGRMNHYEYRSLGINSRMDAFQATIISEKVQHIDEMNNRRREIAQRYTNALKEVGFINTPIDLYNTHVYHQYCITTENRTFLQEHLENCGIQTRVFYPEILPSIPFLQTHPQLITSCPIADHATQTILALPIWPELTNEEVDYVIESIQSMPQITLHHTTATSNATQV